MRRIAFDQPGKLNPAIRAQDGRAAGTGQTHKNLGADTRATPIAATRITDQRPTAEALRKVPIARNPGEMTANLHSPITTNGTGPRRVVDVEPIPVWKPRKQRLAEQRTKVVRTDRPKAKQKNPQPQPSAQQAERHRGILMLATHPDAMVKHVFVLEQMVGNRNRELWLLVTPPTTLEEARVYILDFAPEHGNDDGYLYTNISDMTADDLNIDWVWADPEQELVTYATENRQGYEILADPMGREDHVLLVNPKGGSTSLRFTYDDSGSTLEIADRSPSIRIRRNSIDPELRTYEGYQKLKALGIEDDAIIERILFPFNENYGTLLLEACLLRGAKNSGLLDAICKFATNYPTYTAKQRNKVKKDIRKALVGEIDAYRLREFIRSTLHF